MGEYCVCTSSRRDGFSFDDSSNYWVHALCRKPTYTAVHGQRSAAVRGDVIVTHTSIDFAADRPLTRFLALYDKPPAKFRGVVCTCPNNDVLEKVRLGYNWERHYPYCARCSKMFVTRLFQCLECDEIHLKDFVHPAYCSIHPFCWNHLDHDLSIAECGCSGPTTDTRHDCTIEPWTFHNVKREPVDLSDFDPFAPLSF